VSACEEVSRALGLAVTGVRRVRVQVVGQPRADHPNAFELCLPAWGGWSRPVKTKTIRSRPALELWARQRGSVVEFHAPDGRRVLALLHRAAEESSADRAEEESES
jgi:hypothetical protein